MTDAFVHPPFLDWPGIKIVFALAKAAGGEARIVGGAVRDWMRTDKQTQDGDGRAKETRTDIDMAVNVPITTFMEVARNAGYQVIETGLSHGSVTLMAEGMPIEVTQTRTDINPDGRHSEIGFTPLWEEDAKRRDFTINALYLDEAGQLYDPVGGLADLQTGRLSFIGNAAARISEDYLRILRACRFYAQLPELEVEADIAALLAAERHHLATLSGERIAAELQKTFAGRAWPRAMALMQETRIDEALFGASFLSLSPYFQEMDKVWPATWLTRFACHLPAASARKASMAYRFSKAHIAFIDRLHTPLNDADFRGLSGENWAQIAYFQPQDLAARILVQSRHHGVEISPERLRQIDKFVAPSCPLNGHDLIEAGYASGAKMGALLEQARRAFAASNFTATKSALLALILREYDEGDGQDDEVAK